jgi:hypothetical protein
LRRQRQQGRPQTASSFDFASIPIRRASACAAGIVLIRSERWRSSTLRTYPSREEEVDDDA